MKITIDTKEDSIEEIKKVIGLLSSFIEKKDIVCNKDVFEKPDLLKTPLKELMEINEGKEEIKQPKATERKKGTTKQPKTKDDTEDEVAEIQVVY